ncbi:hypothetical protein QL285_074836 [Trifolium repens]|nr:hypothetical protein QL285_074836 [Trifolium repens]
MRSYRDIEMSKRLARLGRRPHQAGLKWPGDKRVTKNKARARPGSDFWPDTIFPLFFTFFFILLFYYYVYQK